MKTVRTTVLLSAVRSCELNEILHCQKVETTKVSGRDVQVSILSVHLKNWLVQGFLKIISQRYFCHFGMIESTS